MATVGGIGGLCVENYARPPDEHVRPPKRHRG